MIRKAKKRIFVGIKISKSTKQEVKNIQDDLLDKTKLRLIEPNNLHLTLVPPWYEENLRRITKNLSKIKDYNLDPFTIKFKLVETGPGNNKRLVWIAGERSERLTFIKRVVHKILGIKKQKRLFIPHITIARKIKGANLKKVSKKIQIIESVNNVTLFESKLSPKGANYLPLISYNLSSGLKLQKSRKK